MKAPSREIRPQPGPQTAFLTSRADIVIYGGAAGGGKSWGLLLEPLRHIHNPRFGAAIFRRQSPQITNEGGLWDEAGQIYPMVGGTPRVGDLDYRFRIHGRPGGKISFRHLQHEVTKYNWQGSQVPLLCFDELTHFSESQFWYMLSRNRSMCGVRPYVRATTNPDAGSWVKRLLAPWVDRKFRGRKAASGEVRWMIRHKGEIQWGETEADLKARFPGCLPKSIAFIRASVHDNKALLAQDPGYLANLEMLPPVERARLLLGDWDIVNQGLVYPDFGTIVIEPEDWPADLSGRRVGGIDWGFNDPFAAPLAIEDLRGRLWVHFLHYESRMTPTAISKALPRFEHDEPRWWADPSQPGLIAELRAADHDIVACTHQGPEPIKSGVAMVTQRILDKTLFVRGDCGALIEEAGKYRYPEPGTSSSGTSSKSEKPLDKDNHAMDALRYLVVGHDRGRVVDDEAPPESEASIAAKEEAEAAEREDAEAAYYDHDAEHWWER